MTRNATESDFRTSKMAAGSQFEKKINNNKNCGIEMVRNAIQSDLWTSKMAIGSHLKKNVYKKVARMI